MSFAERINDKLRCTLCPHTCTIAPGKTGRCRIRQNRDGELDLPYAGVLSSVALDPIEKKPLYHFHPGEQILSIGFYGCNLRCPFCQNHSISQTSGRTERTTPPEKVVELAKEHHSFGIAYTYSEPLVHFEFVKETCTIARAAGVKNVLVTNGYLNPEPATELLPLVDAANVDLKCFSDNFYRTELGGSLEAVLEFIRLAHQYKVHLELTTLVIPGKNDSDEEILSLVDFIASVEPDIPYHLSAYYPAYHYTLESTRPERIIELVSVAKTRLRFVYPGNICEGNSDTVCPECGSTIIRRYGYRTQITGLRDGACLRCGQHFDIPGLL